MSFHYSQCLICFVLSHHISLFTLFHNLWSTVQMCIVSASSGVWSFLPGISGGNDTVADCRQISSQGNMCSASSASTTCLLNICSALLTTRAARLSPIAQLSDSRRTADRRDHYRVYCQDQEIPENWADMRQRSEEGRIGSKGRKTWLENPIHISRGKGEKIAISTNNSELRLSASQSWQFFLTLCSRSS